MPIYEKLVLSFREILGVIKGILCKHLGQTCHSLHQGVSGMETPFTKPTKIALDNEKLSVGDSKISLRSKTSILIFS